MVGITKETRFFWCLTIANSAWNRVCCSSVEFVQCGIKQCIVALRTALEKLSHFAGGSDGNPET